MMKKSLLYAAILFGPLGAVAKCPVDVTMPPPSVLEMLKHEESLSGFKLSSIVAGHPKGRHAVINNTKVKEGDYVGGYHVTALHKTSAVLTGSDKRVYTLHIAKTGGSKKA
jgi:hypothetical protein